jgi:hypothetical protein
MVNGWRSSGRDNNSEIYVRDMQTGALANVSNHPDRDYDPAWSLDGRRLARVPPRLQHGHLRGRSGQRVQINVSQHEAADLDPVCRRTANGWPLSPTGTATPKSMWPTWAAGEWST